MEEVIHGQIKGKGIDDIDELILDSWHGSEISTEEKKMLEGYPNICFLSLAGCGLDSLANFPYLPGLLQLELSNNNIRNGLENISCLKELTHLSLEGNQFTNIDDLKPLAKLSKLVSLELIGCPISEIEDYGKSIFGMMPELQILDGCDADGNEISILTNEEEEYDEDEIDESEGEYNEEEDYESDEEELPMKRQGNRNYSESDEEAGAKKPKKHK
ncbi:unnamed protein product [Blepharisma stoltei]|uniref:Acidic leucine-rich nuclear phosphoprotein 32 family member A n=1 Tax=Blepharisma stoltei TaxID=1481888 RepID=A0AAU9JLC1_9CILI|nr:unnamed protein product [Blepharisma stoltei]